MHMPATFSPRLYDSHMPDLGDEEYLTLDDIAQLLGWTIKTARTMQHRANRNRRSGESRPGDLPSADLKFGRTPVWRAATIDAWMRSRPGRGAGGGPKPRR
jgi:hypothetical protein